MDFNESSGEDSTWENLEGGNERSKWYDYVIVSKSIFKNWLLLCHCIINSCLFYYICLATAKGSVCKLDNSLLIAIYNSSVAHKRGHVRFIRANCEGRNVQIQVNWTAAILIPNCHPVSQTNNRLIFPYLLLKITNRQIY